MNDRWTILNEIMQFVLGVFGGLGILSVLSVLALEGDTTSKAALIGALAGILALAGYKINKTA